MRAECGPEGRGAFFQRTSCFQMSLAVQSSAWVFALFSNRPDIGGVFGLVLWSCRPQRSVNLRLWYGGSGFKEVEVAAVFGLGDVFLEHAAVAASVARFGGDPGGFAAGHFFIRYAKRDGAVLDADFDFVAGLDEGEWTADEAFR